MILSLAIKLNLDLGQETKVGQVLSIHAESSTSQLLGDLITVKFSSELYLMLIVLSSSWQHLKLYPTLVVIVTVTALGIVIFLVVLIAL